MLIASLLAKGHLLIKGAPSIAKTITVKLLVKSLSFAFNQIQFTPDLTPSNILGTSTFNLKEAEIEFKKGPIFSNMILIDEINRAQAKHKLLYLKLWKNNKLLLMATPIN